jgi:hypothetical protein
VRPDSRQRVSGERPRGGGHDHVVWHVTSVLADVRVPVKSV